MSPPSPPLAFTFGKYRGQPVDTRFRRSIRLREERDESIIVDDFYHEGQFFSAIIPKSGVLAVQGNRFNFRERASGDKKQFHPLASFLNHAQTRFIMRESSPIRLYDPNDRDFGDCLHELFDVTYSLEAVGPRGVTWSFQDSFGDLVAAHRFLSTREVYFERIILKNYLLHQTMPLRLTSEQLDQVFLYAVQTSIAADSLQKYYLFHWLTANNCTSEPFKILDQVLFEQYTFWQKCSSRILFRFPVNLRSYLQLRGVLDTSQAAPSLNEELQHLDSDPHFRVRLSKI